jgi:ribosome recycling factor
MEQADFEKRLTATREHLEREYSGIRTGQAAPAILDGIKVESYGSMMPINQVASVGIEDARTLRISPWDASQIAAIERAVADADLGVSVGADSSGLRISFPELSSERREQLIKLAKTKLEEARVAVRAARDERMKALEKQEKNGDITEDDLFKQKELAQKKVEECNKLLETLFDAKEVEIRK